MLGSLGRRTLLIALIFTLGVLLGALHAPVRGFLNQQVEDLVAFVEGHPLEPETTVWQKIEHDLGLAPWRASREPSSTDAFDYHPLTPASGLESIFPESEIELFIDADAPALADYAGMLVKTQVDDGRGYSARLLLVGFDGRVHKLIPQASGEACDCSASQPLNYFQIEGDRQKLKLSGNSLVNRNSCGQVAWSVNSRYLFHHYLNNDGDHRQPAFWVLDATDLVQIETHSGQVLERISISEIINANPQLALFESRLKGTLQKRWVYGDTRFEPIGRSHRQVENADTDPFHTNDIDAYSGEAGGLFEQGDLVLSMRSLNLLLVVRPATRKVVWFASGLTSRQHDPDFRTADSIVVYDNNFHNSSSRILRLEASASAEPDTSFGTRRINLVDSAAGQRFQQLTGGYQFYLDDGHSMIVSANHFNFGIDTDSNRVFLAIRHRWREQAFFGIDIERMLTRQAFDDIATASCQ